VLAGRSAVDIFEGEVFFVWSVHSHTTLNKLRVVYNYIIL